MSPLPPLAAIACALALVGCGGGAEAAALGTPAEVGHVDVTSNVATTLALTVTDVREGTVEELEAAGLQFDPEERSLVPHYVDASYSNTGDETVERTMRVSVEDDEGNLISPTVIFDFAGDGGESGPCPDVTDGELAPGDSFEDCTLFLLPQGVPLARVSFLSQTPGEEGDFLYWTAE